MDAIAVLGRLLLAGIFALAGVAKLMDRASSIQSLVAFGVPQFLARPFALMLPVLELGCAVALIPAASARWGATGVLVLLALFIVGISVSLARGRAPPTATVSDNCDRSRSGGRLWCGIWCLLAGIAAVIIQHDAEQSSTNIVSGMTGIARVGSASAVAAMIAVALAAFALYLVFHVLRQNGRLLMRLEAVEGKLGIVASAPAPAGLPVGSPAPGFTLSDLDGGTVTLDMLREDNKPLLLVFSEPRCGACDLPKPTPSKSSVPTCCSTPSSRPAKCWVSPERLPRFSFDEQNRVASDIAVGRESVMALASSVVVAELRQ
jgi:hypothetical protein